MSKSLGRLWRNYNLSITLATLFLVSLLAQWFTGWSRFAAEQVEAGAVPAILGSGGYVWAFLEEMTANWQSEFLQLLTFVVLTSFLIHRGSHESRDSDDEMRRMLARIEQRLITFERTQPTQPVQREQRGQRPHPTTHRGADSLQPQHVA